MKNKKLITGIILLVLSKNQFINDLNNKLNLNPNFDDIRNKINVFQYQ